MFGAKTLVAGVVVLAALATLVVSADASSKSDQEEEQKKILQTFCKKLEDHILVDDIHDRGKVFKAGYAYLTNPMNKVKGLFNKANKKVARAWKAAHNGESCSDKSGEYVTLLSACQEVGMLQNNMLLDAKEYADKCVSGPQYWDNLLTKALEGSTESAKLVKFIDDEFIEKYKQDNPKEIIDLNKNCCYPSNSMRPSYDAFVSVITKGDSRAVEKIKERPDDIEDVITKALYKPCQSYLQNVFPIIWYSRSASKVVDKGAKAFTESLSENYNKAIFRYNFCLNELSSPQEILYRVAWALLNPGADFEDV